MTLGQNLNRILEEKNIKQKELAKAIKVSEATISRYIKNQRIPKANILNDMATILGVTTNELLGMQEQDIYAKIGKSLIHSLRMLSDEERKLLINELL